MPDDNSSIPLRRAELVDVRLAVPVLLGTIKNARRLGAALALPIETQLAQLEVGGEEIAAVVGGPEDNQNGVRVPGSLRRALRIALGLQLGRLNKARAEDEGLELDTAPIAKRISSLESLVRRLEDQLDAVEQAAEEDNDK